MKWFGLQRLMANSHWLQHGMKSVGAAPRSVGRNFSGRIPKFAFSAWLALHGRFLTIDQLQRRGLQLVNQCVLCWSAMESIDHLFFNCAYTAWIWRSLLGRAGCRRRPRRNLQQEVEILMTSFGQHDLLGATMRIAFSASRWHVWTERNNRILRGTCSHKKQVLRRIVQDVVSKAARSRWKPRDGNQRDLLFEKWGIQAEVPIEQGRSVKWSIPEPGTWKANADAALKDEKGGLGALIRDENGAMCVAVAKQVEVAPIFVLELRAIKERVEMALQKGWSRLEIETDSLLAKQCLLHEVKRPWASLHLGAKQEGTSQEKE